MVKRKLHKNCQRGFDAKRFGVTMTEFEAEALQQLQQINDTLKRLEDLAQWLAERIKQREADERKAAETLSKLL